MAIKINNLETYFELSNFLYFFFRKEIIVRYLPIQNEEKISPNRSSDENSPVICPRDIPA